MSLKESRTDAMTLSSLWRAGVGVLLFLFCWRIWSLGITNHDDAEWFVSARQGDWGIIRGFAVDQGRIWAFISGTLLYVALYFNGTVLGEVLKIGSVVIFFLLFYRVIFIYFGERTALLAATLNLALFALRWDGSLIVCYPAYFWVLGSLALCAIMLSQCFLDSGKAVYLYGSMALLFLSLFTQEGASLLLAMLFMLSIFGNYYLLGFQRLNTSFQSCLTPPCRKLTLCAIATIAFYFLLYFLWRITHPSGYGGNTIGHMMLSRVLPTLFRYAIGGSVLSDVYSPYVVAFNDTVGKDGFTESYSLFSYIKSSMHDGIALLYGMGVFALVFSLIGVSASAREGEIATANRKAFSGLLVGVVIAILPILPVALVEKYQRQFYEMDIQCYSYTALSHFGITLALAVILIRFCSFRKDNAPWPGIYAVTVPACIAVLAIGGYGMNNDIASDMRVESSRWKAVDQAMGMMAMMGIDPENIYAPRLESSSWFTVLNTDDWATYVSAVHHKQMRFWSDALPHMDAKAANTVFMDYQLGYDKRQVIVQVAPLSALPDHSIVATGVALSIDHPVASDYQQYVLSFQDKVRGLVFIRFGQLDKLQNSRSARAISGIEAVPSSIRFERHSVISPLPANCGNVIPVGVPVSFGTQYPQEPASCNGGTLLGDGWNGREPGGIWSKSGNATLVLPTAGLPEGDLHMAFSLGSYVGMGYAEGMQQVSVSAGGKVLATRTDKKGAGSKPLSVTIPADAWSSAHPLVLMMGVNRTFNPNAIYSNGDTRDIGLLLLSLAIESGNRKK